MPKVTSKLQVTIPKAIADAHRIRPGVHIVFESADDTIRIRVTSARARPSDLPRRLSGFDAATRRQAERDQKLRAERPELFEGVADRGWRREDLYDRGVPR